jgi:hypothetical protein
MGSVAGRPGLLVLQHSGLFFDGTFWRSCTSVLQCGSKNDSHNKAGFVLLSLAAADHDYVFRAPASAGALHAYHASGMSVWHVSNE